MDILQNYSQHFWVILSKKLEKKKFEKSWKKKQLKKKWNKKNSILIDCRILKWQIVYLFLLQKIKSLKKSFIFNSWWVRILICFPFNKIHLKLNEITVKILYQFYFLHFRIWYSWIPPKEWNIFWFLFIYF